MTFGSTRTPSVAVFWKFCRQTGDPDSRFFCSVLVLVAEFLQRNLPDLFEDLLKITLREKESGSEISESDFSDLRRGKKIRVHLAAFHIDKTGSGW